MMSQTFQNGSQKIIMGEAIQTLALEPDPDSPGRFSGVVTPSPGQRDLVIELSREGERLFRSKERIILR